MSNVIWVDENDNVLGEISREQAHDKNMLHRVAAIFLLNDRGEILVNERAKDGYLDHSSAGHVEVGESYLIAAKRELEEELGVANVELHELGLTKEDDKSDRRHIYKVFICRALPRALNEKEVKSVFWANPAAVLEDMKKSPEKYTGGFKSTLNLFLKERNAGRF